MHPDNTDRIYGPYMQAVFTGSAYRPYVGTVYTRHQEGKPFWILLEPWGDSG